MRTFSGCKARIDGAAAARGLSFYDFVLGRRASTSSSNVDLTDEFTKESISYHFISVKLTM
jgi:hypothetical protein